MLARMMRQILKFNKQSRHRKTLTYGLSESLFRSLLPVHE